MNTLQLRFFKVGQAAFTKEQIKNMVHRTEQKLSPLSIQINFTIDEDVWPQHSGKLDYQDIEVLLKSKPQKSSHEIRVFLIKEDLEYKLDSWTYNPMEASSYHPAWEAAIFINEVFNDNHDEHYSSMGYLPSNDTLMHELGHILLDESQHYNGLQNNFFHEFSEKTTDDILESQIQKMLKSPYLKRKP